MRVFKHLMPGEIQPKSRNAVSQGTDYIIRKWLEQTANSTNTKVQLARLEAIKLLMVLKGQLPKGWPVTLPTGLTAESEEPEPEANDGSIAGLRMPEA